MEEKISINITVREEKMGRKKVFIINNDEIGVADFGDNLDEAINNFKKTVKLMLDTYPEKRQELLREEVKTPPLVTRIFI